MLSNKSVDDSDLEFTSPLDPFEPKIVNRYSKYCPKLEKNHQNILKKYGRQLLVKNLGGLEGYERLYNTKILIIGAGGIGSSLLYYLSSSGASITIMDGDSIEESNLHRQIIHDYSRIGMNKAESACLSCLKLNSLCKISFLNHNLTINNIEKIIKNYDIILDGTDNIETRLLLNDFLVYKTRINFIKKIYENLQEIFNIKQNFHLNKIKKLNLLKKENYLIFLLLNNQIQLISSTSSNNFNSISSYFSSSSTPSPIYKLNNYLIESVQPLLSAAAITMDATITTILPFFTPCYRCINFPSEENSEDSEEIDENNKNKNLKLSDKNMINSNELAGACSNLGVFGPIPGLIGVLLAIEAIKVSISLPKHYEKITDEEKENDLEILYNNIKNNKNEKKIQNFISYQEYDDKFLNEFKEMIENLNIKKYENEKENLVEEFLFEINKIDQEEDYKLSIKINQIIQNSSEILQLDSSSSSYTNFTSSHPKDFFVNNFSYYNNNQLYFDGNTGQFHNFALYNRLDSCRACGIIKKKRNENLTNLHRIKENLTILKDYLQENRKKMIGEIRHEKNSIKSNDFIVLLNENNQENISSKKKLMIIIDVRSVLQFNLSNLSRQNIKSFASIDSCLQYYEDILIEKLNGNKFSSFDFSLSSNYDEKVYMNIPLEELKKIEKVKNEDESISFSMITIEKLKKLFYLLYNKFNLINFNTNKNIKNEIYCDLNSFYKEYNQEFNVPENDFFVMCRRGNDSIIATNFLLDNFLKKFNPVNIEKGIESLSQIDSSFHSY